MTRIAIAIAAAVVGYWVGRTMTPLGGLSAEAPSTDPMDDIQWEPDPPYLEALPLARMRAAYDHPIGGM